MAEAALRARRQLAMNAKAIRERIGWTQEVAAERIGCSVQQIQRLERADVNASIDFLAALVHAYKADLADLFAPAGPWRAPVVGRPSGEALAQRAAERAPADWHKKRG
jgi:transcriptional regulator with XRE-family HTH domain